MQHLGWMRCEKNNNRKKKAHHMAVQAIQVTTSDDLFLSLSCPCSSWGGKVAQVNRGGWARLELRGTKKDRELGKEKKNLQMRIYLCCIGLVVLLLIALRSSSTVDR